MIYDALSNKSERKIDENINILLQLIFHRSEMGQDKNFKYLLNEDNDLLILINTITNNDSSTPGVRPPWDI